MIWGLVPLPAAPSALCLGWEWHVWVIGSDSCESITNPWFLNDSSRSSSLKPQCFQPHIFVFHLLYNVFIIHRCRALQNIANMWVWGFCSLKVSLTAERIGQVQLDLALVIKSVNSKYPQNCFICALFVLQVIETHVTTTARSHPRAPSLPWLLKNTSIHLCVLKASKHFRWCRRGKDPPCFSKTRLLILCKLSLWLDQFAAYQVKLL